ncbi:Multidrug resistance protein 1 [Nowakowskiella sp. JEL0407]|nr:Multidrug resistance protein 1 [Nowakowskiella sp. JEL0407]
MENKKTTPKQSLFAKWKSSKVPDEEKPKEEKPAPDPLVPIGKLFKFATTTDRIMLAIAILFAAGMGALMPLSFLILGDFVNQTGPGMAGIDSFASVPPESLTPQQKAEFSKLIGVCPDGKTPKVNIDVNGGMSQIWLFLYFGIGMLVAGYISQLFFLITGNNQGNRIKREYVHSVLRQDPGWFDKAEDGSLTTRLAQDTYLIQDGISEKLGKVIQGVVGFLGGFIIAFYKSWKMSLVIFSAVPFFGIGFYIMMTGMSEATSGSQNSYAEAGSVAEQVISGIRTVQAFSMQPRFIKLYAEKLRKAYFSDVKQQVAGSRGLAVFLFSMFAAYGLAFYYGSRQVMWGQIQVGDVLTVFFGIMIGAMSMMQAPPGVQALAKARAAAYKVFAVIERIPEIDTDSKEGIKDVTLRGEIEFRDVEFAYPTRTDVTILKNFNIKIKPGMTVAFVGPSGSGKSTTIALTQRFYDALAGSVLIDGEDIKKYNVSWLRSNIGVVSQEPVLFNATIKQNILLGSKKDEISEEELIAVCKKANCHHFISKLPDGYNTYIGASQLSGGQKQRIAIARALVKDPRILLLDEATSALDTNSERIVQRALDVAAKDRTTLIVAHRLSTIKNADLIVVLDKGVVAETGTHDQLLALGGIYSALVEKQKIKSTPLLTANSAANFETDISDISEIEESNEESINAELEREAIDTERQAMIIKSDTYDKDGKVSGLVLKLEGVEDFREFEEQKLKSKREEKSEGRKQKAPIGRVFKLMKPTYPMLAVGAFGAAVAGSAFPLFGIFLTKILILINQPGHQGIDPGPFQGVNFYSFLFVMLGVAAGAGVGLQVYCFGKSSAWIAEYMRGEAFKSLMKQEIAFFDQPENGLGSLTSQLATDASKIGDLIANVMGDATQMVGCAIVGFILAFYYGWQLTLILFVFVPLLMVAEYMESSQEMGFQNSVKESYDHAADTAAEAMKEIRTVASLNRQSYFETRYSVKIERPNKMAISSAYKTSLSNGATVAFQQLLNAAGFYAALRLADACIADFGNSFIVILVLMMTAQTLGRGTLFVSGFVKAKISAIKIFEIIDRKSKIDPDEDGNNFETPLHIDGDVQIKDAKFSYPIRPLDPIFSGELNFSIEKNKTIALVGPSGCGKSTVVGLLERWYDVDGGEVLIDGKNVQKYQVTRGLRKNLSLVGQEPVLFDFSIKENILAGAGREMVTDEEIDEAAKIANIYNFIMESPDKYETRVGDAGRQISGGQKQRVAIARAIIRNPRIMLLDEATSALDSESEKQVQEALDRAVAKGGRTTITIAHRLSTIQDADVIIVLKDGKVIEKGTHFELLKLNGVYSSLVQDQNLNALK